MNDIRYWLKKARDDGFAIGAFNVGNIETFKSVIAAAVSEKSPVIIESSEGETKFMGADNLVDLVANARQETRLPIFLNLDHCRHPEIVREAIEKGYDLVHYDGSKESLETNIAGFKEFINLARDKDVVVEGEMDYIIEGSEVRNMTADEGRQQSRMTDPESAVKFVTETGIDTLAVSVGNIHGLYTTAIKLDFDRLAKIREKIDCFLSLHGGSGISNDQIKQAIEVGRISKINISTELRQALRNKLEEELEAHPDEMALYKLSGEAIEAVQKIAQDKMRIFGSSGKAQ